MYFLTLVLFLGLIGIVTAKSSTGDSVLVVLEPSLKKTAFSTFFGDLERRGYQLSFRTPTEIKPVLVKDDVPTFAHVILFATESRDYAPDITPQSLINVLSKGTNLLIALSPKQTPIYSLAAEFSLILPPPGTPLISHFPQRKGSASIIPIDVPTLHPILRPNLLPVWFSGVPHAFSPNPYVVPIVRAPSESFATDLTDDSSANALVDAADKGGEGLWAGRSLGVVSGFQTKENTRVVWAGGVDMFTNDFMNKELSKGVKSGNREFAEDLSAWVFQESGVLRLENTTHHRVKEQSSQTKYTTNDRLVYTAQISHWDASASVWEPYSKIKDLQLEFTMLDPHIRTALPPMPKSPGKYAVTFRAPDRHGVFKFVINHKRKGWSHLQSSTTVSVVPPRHDEYPRFLSAAWPYYTGAISTSIGFILFSVLWLSGDARELSRKQKGKPKAE